MQQIMNRNQVPQKLGEDFVQFKPKNNFFVNFLKVNLQPPVTPLPVTPRPKYIQEKVLNIQNNKFENTEQKFQN